MVAEKGQEIENQELKLNEQRENYQQMMSDMECRLGGEVQGLNDRLSQMKCQYETMIETTGKETRKKLSESEKEKVAFQEQLNGAQEEVLQVKNEVAVLTSKIGEYNGMISESGSLQVELQDKMSNLEKELTEHRDQLDREKGEREELHRQLEYMQDRNDTLTAELSSQQQQVSTNYRNNTSTNVHISFILFPLKHGWLTVQRKNL